jgi:hypothetical protein
MNERMDRRRFVAAVGGAALTASVRSAQGQAEGSRSDGDPTPGSPANEQCQTTILFFDDQRLNLRDNVQRKIGRPALISESVERTLELLESLWTEVNCRRSMSCSPKTSI